MNAFDILINDLKKVEAELIITLSDGQNKHFNAIDKEIPTAATIIEIINLL